VKASYTGATLVAAAISVYGIWPLGFGAVAQPAAKPALPLPVFEVDPNWPKMPANFKVPFVSGITIDPQGNAWLTTRPARAQPDEHEAIRPPIMIFDPDGNSAGAGPVRAMNGRHRNTIFSSIMRASSGSQAIPAGARPAPSMPIRC
jgi:hypothetical protein